MMNSSLLTLAKAVFFLVVRKKISNTFGAQRIRESVAADGFARHVGSALMIIETRVLVVVRTRDLNTVVVWLNQLPCSPWHLALEMVGRKDRGLMWSRRQCLSSTRRGPPHRSPLCSFVYMLGNRAASRTSSAGRKRQYLARSTRCHWQGRRCGAGSHNEVFVLERSSTDLFSTTRPCLWSLVALQISSALGSAALSYVFGYTLSKLTRRCCMCTAVVGQWRLCSEFACP